MPGTELFGAEERKEINDVLETGVLSAIITMHSATIFGKRVNLKKKLKKSRKQNTLTLYQVDRRQYRAHLQLPVSVLAMR